MKIRFSDIYQSPIGLLEIQADCDYLYSLQKIQNSNININPNKITDETKKQLMLYFDGKLKEFHLKLRLCGSDFNKKVWDILQKIPYGEVRSYKDIAESINNPNAQRAVANANNKNPILIIVPCHRVIRHNNTLGGYAFGSEIKQYLLDLESYRF